jgi:hypothetical protein
VPSDRSFQLAVGECRIFPREPYHKIHRRLFRQARALHLQAIIELSSYIVLGFLFFSEQTPLERARLLETTEIFANIHAAVATGGQTAVPDKLDTDLHFTCFVQAPDASVREAEIATGERRLIELDGRRAGPVDRGKSTDLLKVRATWPGLVHFRGGLMDMWYLYHYPGRGRVCERKDHT